jgi:Kelch motif
MANPVGPLGSDGEVTPGKGWFRLRPDASGSYANGTWSTVASMRDSRLYFGSVVLRDGRVFVAGGELGSGIATIELYDPRTDVWTPVQGLGDDIADSTTTVLPDGRVLVLPILEVTGVIYEPTNRTWAVGGTKLQADINSEESVVQLPDGTFLVANVTAQPGAQKYVPWYDIWVGAGTVPVPLVDSHQEIGPGLLLYDGRALFLGATGNTAFYTRPPSNPLDAGTWQTGPIIPEGKVTDDSPAAVMPNGRVLFVASSGGFQPSNGIFELDPVSPPTISPAPTPWANFSGVPAYKHRMLILPTGQVAMANSNGQMALYNPAGGPDPAWKPSVTSVQDNNNGSYFLAGVQLNGLTEGAYFGDDAQMSTNYPIARLIAGGGVVRYAQTYDVNSNGVATGAGSTSFKVPRVPAGAYTLSVVANGIASNAFPLTVTATAAQCNDGVKNGGETDVDCSGPSCTKCLLGQTCQTALDCATGQGICWLGKCSKAYCTDHSKNGDETAVDCSGPNCPGCLLGQTCQVARDCAAGQGICWFGKCSKAYCTDHTKNGDETAVDCGGSTCARCAAGLACALNRDCQSNACRANLCQ